MTFLATTFILLLCMLGLSIGYIITKKPFRKHCSMEPSKDCDCDDPKTVCDKKNDLTSQDNQN